MRVAVVAWGYPSPADPVVGIWAHRQAIAAREAGADVRVLVMRRPVPPLATLRALAASPPDPGPLIRWARGLRSTLQRFEDGGVSVEPVLFVAPPRPRSEGTWGYWMAPPLGRALDRLRARFPFDLVHAHDIAPPGYAAWRWTRSHETPLVVSGHGADMTVLPDRSRIARRAAVAVLRGARLVVANSRRAQRRCEEIAGGPVRSTVIHLGTDLPEALPPRRGRPTIVTVAHLIARKRHAVVLHALAEIQPRLDLDYLVIGEGPARPALERLASKLGLDGRVRFTGQLENERALAEMRRCHVYVMPSADEPFGVAFVEAMAGGLPAIGAQGAAGPEDIAAAGEGMVLVPPDDHLALARAIEGLFAHGPAALGEAARETVRRHFTWERCGRATVEAYESALRR